MSIFYPNSDIDVQWPGVQPLGEHYLAVKDVSVDKYIYYLYDGDPSKLDKYGISISPPSGDLRVYVKCKIKAGSSIPAAQNPNNSHLIITLGYTDKIIDEIYISKNYTNLTPEWQTFSSLVYLNQPHHFHHYHSLPNPLPPEPHEYHLALIPDSDIEKNISHLAPPAVLTDQQILYEINYITVTGVLMDPTSYLYVSSLSIEILND